MSNPSAKAPGVWLNDAIAAWVLWNRLKSQLTAVEDDILPSSHDQYQRQVAAHKTLSLRLRGLCDTLEGACAARDPIDRITLWLEELQKLVDSLVKEATETHV